MNLQFWRLNYSSFDNLMFDIPRWNFNFLAVTLIWWTEIIWTGRNTTENTTSSVRDSTDTALESTWIESNETRGKSLQWAVTIRTLLAKSKFWSIIQNRRFLKVGRLLSLFKTFIYLLGVRIYRYFRIIRFRLGLFIYFRWFWILGVFKNR